ncbi:hypothetical protein SAMN04489841_4675 [Natrinema salaciae]|uniref:Uncharacterized protein n=1 Tax=Natrinema salaciae TaxID=1186196 RepID=A0A1H9SEN7_9EURY|nr:hypothetical protein SAMN04489841_4675 [Natrinema salaciae]
MFTYSIYYKPMKICAGVQNRLQLMAAAFGEPQ